MQKKAGNVLMVSNYPSETAYAWWLMEQLWITLAEFYHRRGAKAFLAYPRLTTIPPAIARASIEVHELTVPGTSRSEETILANFIRRNDIETVYFTDRPWFSLHYASLRRAGVRHILIHDHTPGDRPPVTGMRGILKNLRNRFPFTTADYVFCVSPLMRNRNITNAAIPPERCLTIQNGITPLSNPRNRTEVRAALGIAQDACVVITTGRAHPYKRFDLVVETASLVRTSNPSLKVVFLLVGDGPAFNDLQEQVRYRSLEDVVRLLGYRRDIHDLLFASDIAMHAAKGEGFSLSIIEYMSAGLPVVLPDIPSVSQAIANGAEGLIYISDQASDACSQIVKLASDPSLRVLMGKKGRAKADSTYTLEKCLGSFASSLKQIIGDAHG